MAHINFANSALNTTVATLLNSTQSTSSSNVLNTTVAGHLNATQTISSTVAPLLNATKPILHIQNSTLPAPFGNSSWIPLNNTIANNTSIYGDGPWSYNNSGYWNYTIYCPSCYPNVSINPPIVTYSFAYSYIYYALLLVLLIGAIISIKIGISRRKELERRAAAQRRRGNTYIHNWPLQPFSQDYDLASHTTYGVCVNFIHEWWDLLFKVDSERQIFEKFFMAIFTLRVFARNLLRGRRACQQTAAPYTATNNDNNTNNNGDDMTPKGFDLPPAYDDVVQSYMMAKQNQEREQTQESNVNEGATGGIAANPSTNSISTAVSTLTIETEISNSNHNSIVDLEQATTSTIPNPKSLQQPPSYDHSIEMSAVKNKNDHIV